MASTSTFTKKVLIASVVFLLVAGSIYLLAKFFNFFLLVFAGLLLAVLLSAIANLLVRKLKFNRGVGLAVAVILVLGFTIGLWWLMAPTVGKQVYELRESLPQSLEKLKNSAMDYSLGRKLVAKLEENGNEFLPNTKSVLTRITHFFTSGLEILADVLIIFITGIFFAANPMVYLLNVVNLFPPRSRTRLMEVLDACYQTLKVWLVAKFYSMAIVGVFTAIGLELMGMPMAFALALIAFFITFIPTIGPYLSAVPAVLVAFLHSPQMAFYVILLYFSIQMVETYLITPIIFQQTVKIPPAITLFSLVFLGLFSGVLGILMAGPLVAVIRVFIRELYIKDFLEKKEKVVMVPVPLSERQTPEKPLKDWPEDKEERSEL